MTGNTEHLYYECPWCNYEFRKRRYFQPHVWDEHLNQVWKGDGDPPDEHLPVVLKPAEDE